MAPIPPQNARAVEVRSESSAAERLLHKLLPVAWLTRVVPGQCSSPGSASPLPEQVSAWVCGRTTLCNSLPTVIKWPVMAALFVTVSSTAACAPLDPA